MTLRNSQEIEAALNAFRLGQAAVIRQMAGMRKLDPDSLSLAQYRALILEEATWCEETTETESERRYTQGLRDIAGRIKGGEPMKTVVVSVRVTVPNSLGVESFIRDVFDIGLETIEDRKDDTSWTDSHPALKCGKCTDWRFEVSPEPQRDFRYAVGDKVSLRTASCVDTDEGEVTVPAGSLGTISDIEVVSGPQNFLVYVVVRVVGQTTYLAYDSDDINEIEPA